MLIPHAALIFPHQLFECHPALHRDVRRVILVEEALFFRQYRFHRQKLMLHRASMAKYAERLKRRGLQVDYLETKQLSDTKSIGSLLAKMNVRQVEYVDPNDDWLERRLSKALQERGIAAKVHPDPHFLTSLEQIHDFASGRKRLFFTEFYIAQRHRLDLLLQEGQPVGGKWSFDPDNRKRLPAGIKVPVTERAREDAAARKARLDVRARFPYAWGEDRPLEYAADHPAAARWLETFVDQRLPRFGDYEDAMARQHDVLFHSVLTPMLNIGLLSPRQVVEAALARQQEVPINSLEGFVRQVIGWREFMRLVYRMHGRHQRTRNFWGFTQPMPASFYDGSTGIEPVDHVIQQVLRTGYCHHIERLMILGNFMLLCEIHPDAVYQWFMELFVDAYDWVMVPNVYGMSQYADGGLMTTKPYISGSSYVLKMSDFPRGPWCRVWDALYWRFIARHASVFARNPRMAVMVKMKDKLGAKLREHCQIAEEFLECLHGNVLTGRRPLGKE